MTSVAFHRIGLSLRALELSVKTFNALQMNFPNKTVEEIAEISDEEMKKWPHIGAKAVKEFREAFKNIQFSPQDEATEIMLWAERHRTLVLALMRGEAVIVPSSRLVPGSEADA